VKGEGTAPLAEWEWYPWLGLAVGAFIAAAVGWLSVPNSLVPTDTSDARFRMVGAALLAVAPWTYRLAAGAAERPLSVAIRLFVGTYLLGMLTLGFAGVPFPAVEIGPGPPGPLEFGGYFGAPVPWIAAGVLLWTASMLVLGPTKPPLHLSIRLSASARKRGLALVGAMLVMVVVVLLPGVRRIGWRLQDPPVAHRPAVVGVVASYQVQGARCRIGFSDAGIFETSDPGCMVYGDPVGSLALAGDSGDPWEIYLSLYPTSAPDGSNCWSQGNATRAWDLGDAILFPWLGSTGGLELKKALGFASEYPPKAFFSSLVYDENTACLNGAGQVLYLSSPGYI
jgi:hypothetical protein